MLRALLVAFLIALASPCAAQFQAAPNATIPNNFLVQQEANVWPCNMLQFVGDNEVIGGTPVAFTSATAFNNYFYASANVANVGNAFFFNNGSNTICTGANAPTLYVGRWPGYAARSQINSGHFTPATGSLGALNLSNYYGSYSSSTITGSTTGATLATNVQTALNATLSNIATGLTASLAAETACSVTANFASAVMIVTANTGNCLIPPGAGVTGTGLSANTQVTQQFTGASGCYPVYTVSCPGGGVGMYNLFVGAGTTTGNTPITATIHYGILTVTGAPTGTMQVGQCISTSGVQCTSSDTNFTVAGGNALWANLTTLATCGSASCLEVNPYATCTGSSCLTTGTSWAVNTQTPQSDMGSISSETMVTSVPPVAVTYRNSGSTGPTLIFQVNGGFPPNPDAYTPIPSQWNYVSGSAPGSGTAAAGLAMTAATGAVLGGPGVPGQMGHEVTYMPAYLATYNPGFSRFALTAAGYAFPIYGTNATNVQNGLTTWAATNKPGPSAAPQYNFLLSAGPALIPIDPGSLDMISPIIAMASGTNVPTNAANSYQQMLGGYESTNLTTIGAVNTPWGVNGIVGNMTASTATTLSGSGTYTVGIDNNGTGTGPAGSSFGAVLGSGAQTAEQTTYQFQAVDGNLASMETVPTATPTTISATTPILASAWFQSVDGNEQPLFFGGSQTAPTAGQYLGPGAGAPTSTEATISGLMPAAGNIVGIFAYTSAAAGTSNTQTFTVVYDGVAQSLACSIAGSSQQQCCAVANNVTWNANQAASNSASIACSTGATAVAVAAPSITSGTCGTSCSAHTVSVQVSNGGGSFTGSKTMVTLIWQPTTAGQAILFGNWHALLPGSSATYYCNLQGLCASSTIEAQFRQIIPY